MKNINITSKNDKIMVDDASDRETYNLLPDDLDDLKSDYSDQSQEYETLNQNNNE